MIANAMPAIKDINANLRFAILRNFFAILFVGSMSLECGADDDLIAIAMPNESIWQKPKLRSLETFDLEIRQASSSSSTSKEAIAKSESPLDYRLNGVRGKESPKVLESGRYCENGFKRAGMPLCVGRFAKPSITCSHMIGYVGGGTAFGGQRRTSQEGTFGMDYSGKWFSRKSWLKWSHGERFQAGAGRYETDGPRLLPE